MQQTAIRTASPGSKLSGFIQGLQLDLLNLAVSLHSISPCRGSVQGAKYAEFIVLRCNGGSNKVSSCQTVIFGSTQAPPQRDRQSLFSALPSENSTKEPLRPLLLERNPGAGVDDVVETKTIH